MHGVDIKSQTECIQSWSEYTHKQVPVGEEIVLKTTN